MRILFVQLPIPVLGPQRNMGNHLLASSSLYLHLRNNGVSADIDALPQETCTRGGDQVILDSICKHKPDIAAFTCTVWNIERTLYISRELKALMPNVKIWLGGPEIASDSYFLNDKESCFDLAVEGEGEEIFLRLLKGEDPLSLDRVYIPHGQKRPEVVSVPLLKSLSTIHDPFISGFARMESDGVILSELFRGCKYGCLFCRYHDGKKNGTCSIRPYDQVSDLFSWARANGTKEMFLLDPSFEQRPDISEFLEFMRAVNRNPVIPVFAELRAESVSREFADKLYNAGILHVETGLQTVSDVALRKVGRSLDKDLFSAGVRNLQNAGIKIRTDIMLGLPGDTPEGLSETLQFLKSLQLDKHAQVFRTQILPGTKLRKAAAQYGMRYEDRPPYQVISTPQWSETDLCDALSTVESELDICLTPEERPFIAIASDYQKSNKFFYPGTDICYALYFDTTTDAGIEQIGQELFTDEGNAVSLVIKIDSLESSGLICYLIRKMLVTNPFSTLLTGFCIPPLFPLDIFDDAERYLRDHDYSDYLKRLFPNTYSPRPHRRLLACIRMEDASECTDSWLDALRDICEIVWISDRHGCGRLAALENIPFVMPEDYIYIDLDMYYGISSGDNFSALYTSEHAYQLIFSDIGFQWDFIEKSQDV